MSGLRKLNEQLAEPEMIELEKLTTRAWPSLVVEHYDDWLLRFAQGYTKRANSVIALQSGALPLAQKIEHCEQRYAGQGLPAIFKLTPAMPLLDKALAARGYALIDTTAVQSLSLAGREFQFDAAVQAADRASDAWFDAMAGMNQIGEMHRPIARSLIERYDCPTQFAVLTQDGKAVACAFAVLQPDPAQQMDTVLLYDVVTLAEQRRQGYALRVVEHLLAWAQSRGAVRAVLQVVAANAPAVALYARIGFTEQHRHWYRRQTV